MTKDFMKSAGFHVKSKDLLQGIVTLCFAMFLMRVVATSILTGFILCWQYLTT